MFRTNELLAYQREFAFSREHYVLMLAHKRAGKTRAGLSAALASGRAEIYVSAPGALAETLALAEALTGIKADSAGLLRLAEGASLHVVSAEPENLYNASGNLTIDEPRCPDLWAAALYAAQGGHRLRVVSSAGVHLSLIHQLTCGGLFRVFKTDITRSSGQGFPWTPDWASPLEARTSALYRQEYLCISNTERAEPEPALHWYSVIYGKGSRVCVPGVSREDALRVYRAWPGERPQAIAAEMSATPVLCGDCRAGGAVYALKQQPHKHYCSEHAAERMQAGAAGQSLYIPPQSAVEAAA